MKLLKQGLIEPSWLWQKARVLLRAGSVYVSDWDSTACAVQEDLCPHVLQGLKLKSLGDSAGPACWHGALVIGTKALGLFIASTVLTGRELAGIRGFKHAAQGFQVCHMGWQGPTFDA